MLTNNNSQTYIKPTIHICPITTYTMALPKPLPTEQTIALEISELVADSASEKLISDLVKFLLISRTEKLKLSPVNKLITPMDKLLSLERELVTHRDYMDTRTKSCHILNDICTVDWDYYHILEERIIEAKEEVHPEEMRKRLMRGKIKEYEDRIEAKLSHLKCINGAMKAFDAQTPRIHNMYARAHRPRLRKRMVYAVEKDRVVMVKTLEYLLGRIAILNEKLGPIEGC